MSKNEFALFKKFVNKEQAVELTELLKANEIPFETQENGSFFDATFANNAFDEEIEIKIHQSDFEKTTILIESEYDKVIDQFEGEHYLYDFTNKELLEVIVKPDEWNNFDFKLAQKIIKERNGNVDDKFINKLKANRIQELEKTETPDSKLIQKGYFYAFAGGLIGIFIGYKLYTQKKILPNGKKVYTFSKKDRKHGLYIMLIGLPISLFSLNILINK